MLQTNILLVFEPLSHDLDIAGAGNDGNTDVGSTLVISKHDRGLSPSAETVKLEAFWMPPSRPNPATAHNVPRQADKHAGKLASKSGGKQQAAGSNKQVARNQRGRRQTSKQASRPTSK
jgi:hypothetical protein